MTNTEKAYEILIGMKGVAPKDIMDALKAMAEWKDFQYEVEKGPKVEKNDLPSIEKCPYELYNDFVDEILRKLKTSPKKWRLGQAIYNIVNTMFPIAASLAVKKYDPFYDDSMVYPFLKEVWGILTK